jgi:hypothetical protein
MLRRGMAWGAVLLFLVCCGVGILYADGYQDKEMLRSVDSTVAPQQYYRDTVEPIVEQSPEASSVSAQAEMDQEEITIQPTPGAFVFEPAVKALASEHGMQQKTVEQRTLEYRGELNRLQASCSGKVQQILNDIMASSRTSTSKSGKEWMDTLFNRYIGQIQQAEKTCDQEFNRILAGAQDELGDALTSSGTMEAWKKEYQVAKEQAQQAAVVQLMNLFVPNE